MAKQKKSKSYSRDYTWEVLSGAIAGNLYRKEIRDIAQKVSGEGALEHKKLIEKINQVSPYEIQRDLYTLDYMDLKGEGGFIFNEEGVRHPVVSDTVANLRYFHGNYSESDMFNCIVSHEYGHIIFDELIAPQMRGSRSFRPNERLRQTEAFAFWFGEKISGVEPSEKQMERYSCSINGSLPNAYNMIKGLEDSSGIKDCFNPWELSSVFHRTR